MSGDWEHRTFMQMETSTGNEQYPLFGSPITDGVNRSAYPNGQQPGGQGPFVPQAGPGYTVNPDGTINGRATYGPSGTIPTDNGGTVLFNPNQGAAPYQPQQPYQPGQIAQPGQPAGPTAYQPPQTYQPYQPGQIAQPGQPASPAAYNPTETPPNNPNQNGGRAVYGPSGTIPTDNGGTVPYNPNQQYNPAPGPYQQGGAPYNPSGGAPYNPSGGSPYNPGTNPGRWTPAPDQLPGAGPAQPGQIAQPGATGGGPYGDGTGSTGFGGVTVSPQQRADVNASLSSQYNYTGLGIAFPIVGTVNFIPRPLIYGAFGATLGSGAIPWAMDKITAGEGRHNAVAQYWRDHHSPLQMEVKQQQKLRDAEQAKLDGTGGYREQLSNTASEMNNLRPDLRAARNEVRTKIQEANTAINGDPANPPTGEELQVLQNRRSLYQDAESRLRPQYPSSLPSAEEQTALNNRFADLRRKIEDATIAPGESATSARYLTQAENEALLKGLQSGQAAQAIHLRGLDVRSNIASTEEAVAGLTKKIGKMDNPDYVRFNLAKMNATNPEGQVLGKTAMEENLAAGTTGKLVGQWRGDRWGSRAAEGTLAVTLGLGADYLGDKLLFGNNEMPSQHYWLQAAEAPAMAAAFLLPKNTAMKIGGAVAVPLITKAVDSFLPNNANSTFNNYMKPNWVEGVGMAAAWMLPFDTPGKRFLAVGGAWVAGKGANILAHMMKQVPGLDKIPTGIEDVDAGKGLNDALTSSVKSYNPFSSSSFNNVADASKTLAMDNEGAAQVQLIDFVNKHQNDQNPTTLLSGSAAIATGIGDMQLARGGKLDPSSHNADGRLLAGKNYDLGGQALFYYWRAAGDIVQAENWLKQNHGSQDQINAMQQQQKTVEGRLGTVFGKHDINGCYDELKGDIENKVGKTVTPTAIDQILRFEMNLRQQANSVTIQNPQYQAKMYRDVVLTDLAIAGFMEEKHLGTQNGTDANMYYQQAVQYLTKAGQLDSKNPDYGQLYQLAQQVGQKIPGAIQGQWGNKINNPFGVRPNGSGM